MRRRRPKLRLRKVPKRLEIRRGKRYRTVFIPRPSREQLDDIESSFTPKE